MKKQKTLTVKVHGMTVENVAHIKRAFPHSSLSEAMRSMMCYVLSMHDKLTPAKGK